MTEQQEVYQKRLKALLRHVDSVNNNCQLLAERLYAKGEEDLAHKLVLNGHIHDASKFSGIEWMYLNDDTLREKPELFQCALQQHQTTNLHHPEAWSGGIHVMDRLHLAEMVCDWHTRSQEFGSDLREWIKDKATKKFDMKVQSKVYKEIKGLVDLILDPAFS